MRTPHRPGRRLHGHRPVVHFVMRLLVSIDHNLFRIIRLGAETRGLQIRGVSVLWAMPCRSPSRARDVETSV